MRLILMYSGTPLLRTPLGQSEVYLLQEVSSFQGSFCAHLYVGGTKRVHGDSLCAPSTFCQF